MQPVSQRQRRFGLGALLATVALVMTGCGGSDTQENPASAAESFYHAIGDEDAETACTLVTDGSGQTLTSDSPDFDNCVTFMTSYVFQRLESSDLQWFSGVEVDQAVVEGDEATVTSKDVSPEPPDDLDDDLELLRVDGGWYVKLE